MSTKPKLTEDQKKEIVARYLAGGISQEKLGLEYGVRKKTVWRLLNPNKKAATRSATVPMVVKTLPLPVSRTLGRKMERGSTIITREGSCLQVRANGRLERVMKCPVYTRPRTMCIAVHDIEVTELSGITGKGYYTSLDGTTRVHGELRFDVAGQEVTRVEFHPDTI